MKPLSSTCQICKGTLFKKLFNKKGFDILKCTNCGLVFTNIPKNINLLDIYDESYFLGGQDDGYADYMASEKVLRTEFSKTVRQLRKLTGMRDNLKLLEIGSAYGFFLDEAAPNFSCTGIEVSESGVLFSRQRGHHVVHGIADENTLEKLGDFDVIVMLDVIEHLPHPQETINLLSRHLNTDGFFLIVTGDVSSILAKMTGRFWRLMTPPQHTFYFSGNTLKKLFKNAGLSVLHVDSPWKFIPLGLAMYQLIARMGMKPSSWIGKFNKVGIFVNLFDTVRIIAKK